jgi:hypothetical protein
MLTAPTKRFLALGFGLVFALATAGGAAAANGTAGAAASSNGAPRVSYMRPHGATPFASSTSNLYYHGGTGGIGVETGPKVYLVLWGSHWKNNDPSRESAILQSFYNGVGGSSWNASVTQYCETIAWGTSDCTGVLAKYFAGNPTGMLAFWYDNSSAPRHPGQSQLAGEAVKAAAHFGNTLAGSNNTTQYVIATAHGYNASGFGQYCAWHSWTSSSYGNIAYTNLPYITDAGASCGANFVNAGSTGLTDGITIVAGHEMAETETDQYPSSGWLDSNGAENGDKCAWIRSGQGAAANITLSTGTFAVQSLWSNATTNCVLS